MHQVMEEVIIDKFNCIVCVAGGWTGGSIKDVNLL